MHQLRFTETFQTNYRRLTKRNATLKKKVKKTIQILTVNPSYPSLRNHKAQTRNHGVKWSVSVDKKIRIMYDFSQNNSNIIELLDIGAHRVYK